MTPLVTCFGPFGDVAHNPTVDVTAGFADRVILRTALATLAVPPGVSVAVATGLARKRSKVSVERVAINVADFRIPDVDGAQPTGVPVVVDGPDAYLTSVDVRALCAAIDAAGIAVEVSNTAGTYVCNAWYYALLHAGVDAVFLHLPPLTEVPLQQQVEAVRIALGFVTP